MRKYSYAFTLVELIVVIVILSILGTIGVITFFRENSDARDAVRYSDLSSLSKQLNVQIDTGKISNISSVIQNENISNVITSGSVMSGVLLSNIGYKVGSVDSFKLGDGKRYIDPKFNSPYIVGTIQGSFGQYYQVGASLENQRALVKGNYYKISPSDLNGIIKSGNSSHIVIDNGTALPY